MQEARIWVNTQKPCFTKYTRLQLILLLLDLAFTPGIRTLTRAWRKGLSPELQQIIYVNCCGCGGNLRGFLRPKSWMWKKELALSFLLLVIYLCQFFLLKLPFAWVCKLQYSSAAPYRYTGFMVLKHCQNCQGDISKDTFRCLNYLPRMKWLARRWMICQENGKQMVVSREVARRVRKVLWKLWTKLPYFNHKLPWFLPLGDSCANHSL